MEESSSEKRTSRPHRTQARSKVYTCVKKRAKRRTADEEACSAYVFVSMFSKRWRLIIGDSVFLQNGPTVENRNYVPLHKKKRSGRPAGDEKFVFFKCSVHNCNARAKISSFNLNKLGRQDAFKNNEHSHEGRNIRELKLSRGANFHEVEAPPSEDARESSSMKNDGEKSSSDETSVSGDGEDKNLAKGVKSTPNEGAGSEPMIASDEDKSDTEATESSSDKVAQSSVSDENVRDDLFDDGLKRGNVLKDKIGKVLVCDKITGKILPMQNAPHISQIQKWLSENPGFEPVKPGTPQAESILNKSAPQPAPPAATQTPVEDQHSPTVVYLKDMLGKDEVQLTQKERSFFENEYQMNLADGISDNERSYNELLEVRPATTRKFGNGVFATEDIPQDSLLGYYYGRLCRVLPKDSGYSFKIPVPGSSRKLHVNAENRNERSILGIINHECKKHNARVNLQGTCDGFPQIEFRTTKKICKDEELFINYGAGYFEGGLVCECSTCAAKKK